MAEKTIKNLAKSSKNRPKIIVWGWFWAPWGRPGGVLGRLGMSWGRLGAFCGRSGGVLEAPWGVLKGKRWPTWLQLGSQNGAQIDPKSKQKSINF